MPRSYNKRLLIFTIGSAILHAIGIVVLLFVLFSQHGAGPAQGPVSYLVKLGPAPPEPKELAESTAPTTEPPSDSNLIAETDSQAQDMSNVEGTRNAPFFKQASEMDILAHAPSPASTPPSSPSPPTPPSQPSPAQPPQPSPAATPPAPKTKPAPSAQPPEPPAQVIVANTPNPTLNTKPTAPKPAETTPETPASPPSSQPAPQAAFTPPVSPLALPKTQASNGAEVPQSGPSRGQVDGGVKNEGFVAYEAIRDKIAPYLKVIRDRVELNWQTALHLKYLGTSPTKAVLDCSIGSDGKIVSISIVDAGDATGYAPICKEAIERAGPFDPFPFKVPDMYQNKNLEIRWTFSFLPQ